MMFMVQVALAGKVVAMVAVALQRCIGDLCLFKKRDSWYLCVSLHKILVLVHVIFAMT